MHRTRPPLSLAVTVVITGAVAASSAAVLGQENRPAAVRVWMGNETIPTYPLGPEDPNPHFFELEGSIVYPYTMQDRFGSERVEHSWRAAYLENEYLRVTVLPDIDGRIHSVRDKVTGQEMFYRNGVIRPGHIALRGAWVSGGVEWNRGPQGHTVTSFSPVDVLPQQHPDGSASLLIGTIERNYRTGWQVTLTLRPGVRALDEQIRLYNPTDAVAPYYFWNNAAFPERPGTRFIFPMSLGTDHSATEFFSWPIHDGRDLSWLRNYPEPTSIFGVQVTFDFFGAYDVDRDFGVVQFADHRVLPGKKAWTWGQSDDGRVAQSVLTETDGNYIEIQSGPLPTQSDFGELAPGQEISWLETWYPVDGLGDGFEAATADVAMQRHDRDGAVELRFAATSVAPGASLQVQRQDGRTERHRIDLSPARVARVNLEPSRAADGEPMQLRVLLENAEGRVLLDTRSPLPVPDRQPPAAEPLPDSAEGMLLAGRALERAGDRPAGRARYEAALRLDPGYSAALAALGRMALSAGEWERAAALLEQSLRRDADDGLVWYQLGVARMQQGDRDGAQAAAYQAVKRQGTVALGYSLLGRARARGGDYKGALEAFNDGLAAGGTDWTRLFEYLLLASYGSGEREAAAALARQAVQAGTPRLIPHLVPALVAQTRLTEALRGAREWLGDDDFTILEAAASFADLGLFRDAANVVEATFVAQVAADQRRALPLYWLAWLHERSGEGTQAARWLQLAASRPAQGEMPSRVDSLAVLHFATTENPDDAVAWELLGNLYAGLGRIVEAGAAWQRAAALSPTTAAARRSLGLLAARLEADDAAAERWLIEAAAAAPHDQVVSLDLARVQLRRGDAAAAAQTLESASTLNGRRTDVVVLQAHAYVQLRRFEDALTLLLTSSFSNREGDQGARAVFVQAHLQRAEERLAAGDAAGALADFEAALTYPIELNVGRPYRPREAAAQEGRARALQALGRAPEARDAWRACVDGASPGDGQEQIVNRCRQALAGN